MIIKTFLDTDFYTYTQMQFAFHRYRDVMVEYAFKCRTKGFDFAPFFERIQLEIDCLHNLRFDQTEMGKLAVLGLLAPDFLNWLKDYRMNPSAHITLRLEKDGSLVLRIKGLWLETIPYETPILGIISEVCQAHMEVDYKIAWQNLFEKATLLKASPITLFEFGTRRRQSRYWQELMFSYLRGQKLLAGTSNVELGTRFGVPIIGTVAHQSFQVAQAMAPKLENFLEYFLEEWMREYPNSCKVTLTDIVGHKAFLKALNGKMARHYTGYRHDSGDPYVFGNAMLQRLRELDVNTEDRILVFSDSLTVQKGIELSRFFEQWIQVQIAIGTGLTNDFTPDYKALSIVIKMVTCDDKPVAKLSDDNGKGMCEDAAYAEKLGTMYPR